MGMLLFLAYVLCLVLLGARCAARVRDEGDFYVNGRRSGTATVALSIVASCVGGSATVGMAGLAWQVGTPAYWWLGSGVVGLTILSLLLARKVRASGAMTLPEMLETCLGGSCRTLSSWIILPAWVAILAAQFVAMGAILAVLTGLGQETSMAMGAMVLVGYTLLGGQGAVMESDVWQYLLMAAALVVTLALAAGMGGSGALARAPLEVVNEEFPGSRLRYFLCIIGGGYVVCPMLFGRVFSARDAATARRGGLWAVGGLAVTAAVIVALGIACRDVVPQGTPPEEVLCRALPMLLPDWAASLLMLGLFSAVVSSADSCLITAAGVLSRDVLQRPSPGSCRCCMVLLGGAALWLAFGGEGILSLLLKANDIYVCGVVVPVFVGLVLQGRARVVPVVAAVAMAGGGALGLVAAVTGDAGWSYAGLGFALATSLAALRPLGRRSDAFVSQDVQGSARPVPWRDSGQRLSPPA
jgi:SSS family solute:Na+ symporter